MMALYLGPLGHRASSSVVPLLGSGAQRILGRGTCFSTKDTNNDSW